MQRIQLYLGDEEVSALDAAVRRTGAGRSELICRAIRAQYGQHTKAQLLDAVRSSAGSWTEARYRGAEYVDAIRGDVNERLARLRSS